MQKSFKYIPQSKRKKILLICDDIRVHSGVATVAKQIVLHTCHHFNWCQMAGAIQHPQKGSKTDLSPDTNKMVGIEDSYVVQYPVDGYGDPAILRSVMKTEKPDAILLITDPRYFKYIFDMEAEIRKDIPIAYLNIWDDYPAPMYNKPFYEACDLLMGISKQTVNINKIVLSDVDKPRIFKYVPHGLGKVDYYPIDKDHEQYAELNQFRDSVFQGKQSDFTVFFNSRNIRRKQIPDTLLAFRTFLDSLPKEKADKCHIILHTEAVSDAGTDLYKVNEYLLGEKYGKNVIFSHNKLDTKSLNFLYNIADVQVLITSNEGWGLTITEAMLAGTPIIANATGGMQDQMRFEDKNGKWFEPDSDIPSNHRKTFTKHGEWAFPVYPACRSIQGSPPTPYIFDDRCRWEDVADRFKEVYNLSSEERKRRGLKGREWAISDEAGFTAEHQGQRVLEAFTELFETWKPREKYELFKANDIKGNYLTHKLFY